MLAVNAPRRCHTCGGNLLAEPTVTRGGTPTVEWTCLQCSRVVSLEPALSLAAQLEAARAERSRRPYRRGRR